MYVFTLFLCFIVLFYVFFGYPLLLRTLAARRQPNSTTASAIPAQSGPMPKILIVVPAHNEEIVMERKIRNHMALDYPNDEFQVLVISDGSTDATDSIVKQLQEEFGPRLWLRRVEDRLGKTNAINQASDLFTGFDLLVFSDANVYLRQDALTAVADAFTEREVGGVSGKLIYFNGALGDGSNTVEVATDGQQEAGIVESTGAYWKYEEGIKRTESVLGNVMGADGSIFAIRAALYRRLPLHVLDDFSSSMGVVFQGYQLKFSDAIVAYEKTTESDQEEFGRKVRIANRSFNTYLNFKTEVAALSLWDQFKFHSHKTLRWFAFIPMMLAWLMSVGMVLMGVGYWLPFAIACGGLVLWGYPHFSILQQVFGRIPGLGSLINFASYFVVANVATGVGVWMSLSGKRIAVWRAAASTR